MSKPTGSQLSLAVVIVLMVGVIAATSSLEFFASKLLPRLVAGLVLALAIIALVAEIRSAARNDLSTQVEGKNADTSQAAEDKVIFVMAAWIGGLALIIYLLGFLIASLLFVSTYMKWHGARWSAAILGSAIFTATIYIIFNIALQVDLYRGLMFL